MSRVTLASLAEASEATNERIEAGRHSVGIYALVKVCEVLRLPLQVGPNPWLKSGREFVGGDLPARRGQSAAPQARPGVARMAFVLWT